MTKISCSCDLSKHIDHDGEKTEKLPVNTRRHCQNNKSRQLHEPSESPLDYDFSSTRAREAYSDRQRGERMWNAEEVRSLEVICKLE